MSGRVQGVWFRQSCRELAAASGVRGWVRNNTDGSVEAVLEGEPAAVDRVAAWMGHGPTHAEVRAVRLTEEAPVGEGAFEVR